MRNLPTKGILGGGFLYTKGILDPGIGYVPPTTWVTTTHETSPGGAGGMNWGKIVPDRVNLEGKLELKGAKRWVYEKIVDIYASRLIKGEIGKFDLNGFKKFSFENEYNLYGLLQNLSESDLYILASKLFFEEYDHELKGLKKFELDESFDAEGIRRFLLNEDVNLQGLNKFDESTDLNIKGKRDIYNILVALGLLE